MFVAQTLHDAPLVSWSVARTVISRKVKVMEPVERFRLECIEEVRSQGLDRPILDATRHWLELSVSAKYCYHFEWMGRPIIQYPQDILAMQEIIFNVKPDLIVETGIAHGGSLILYSSLLELNEIAGGPRGAEVVGVDIDIRLHNQKAIEAHPMASRITMIEGSSVDPEIVRKVSELAANKNNILVCLDSFHSYGHVLAELEAYAPLTSVGSYCVVFDTIADSLPPSYSESGELRWAPGDSPLTAVEEFLGGHPEFEPDRSVTDKILITVNLGGYLRRIE